MRGRPLFPHVLKDLIVSSFPYSHSLPPAAAGLSFLIVRRVAVIIFFMVRPAAAASAGGCLVGRRLRRALPRAAAPSGGRAPELRLVCAPLDCPSGNLRTKGCSAEQPFFIHSATLGGMAAVAYSESFSSCALYYPLLFPNPSVRALPTKKPKKRLEQISQFAKFDSFC